MTLDDARELLLERTGFGMIDQTYVPVQLGDDNVLDLAEYDEEYGDGVGRVLVESARRYRTASNRVVEMVRDVLDAYQVDPLKADERATWVVQPFYWPWEMVADVVAEWCAQPQSVHKGVTLLGCAEIILTRAAVIAVSDPELAEALVVATRPLIQCVVDLPQEMRDMIDGLDELVAERNAAAVEISAEVGLMRQMRQALESELDF